MLNTKSKKIGFIGTFLFHVLLILICFFVSVGHTSIIVPEGIEVQYIPYEKLVIKDEIIIEPKPTQLDIETIENDEVLEKLIVEDVSEVTIPNDEDTIQINKLELVETPSLSSQLETALAKLNETQSSRELLNDNMDDTITLLDDVDLSKVQDGYILSDNRFAIVKIKPNYSCKESGKVIVRVWVNREGVTVKAEPGIRGTTESASCLLKEAKIAALQTTWTPYLDAPDIQIGQITYNFYHN